MSNTIGWKDILDSHFLRSARDFIHTSFPAEITRVVNSAVVDVKPLVVTTLLDGTVRNYPELYNVRIQNYVAMQGNIGVSIPFAVGDKVWVHVSERDTSTLYNQNIIGGTTTATHDLSDCYCTPSFFTTDIPEYSSEDLVIFNHDTNIIVKKDSISITTPEVNADTNINTNNIDAEAVSANSIDATEFKVNGAVGIDAVFTVGSDVFTVTKGIITKKEPA